MKYFLVLTNMLVVGLNMGTLIAGYGNVFNFFACMAGVVVAVITYPSMFDNTGSID